LSLSLNKMATLPALEKKLAALWSGADTVSWHDSIAILKECQDFVDTSSPNEWSEHDEFLWSSCYHRLVAHCRQQLLVQHNAPTLSLLGSIIDMGLSFYTERISLLCTRSSLSDREASNLSSLFSTLRIPLNISNSSGATNLMFSLSKLLICCGDLARYRCRYIAAFEIDDYRLAWQFYHTAHQLYPHNGHAANQLAIVSSQNGSNSKLTMEWYLRSLCCSNSFEVAKENFRLWLQKNSKDLGTLGSLARSIFDGIAIEGLNALACSFENIFVLLALHHLAPTIEQKEAVSQIMIQSTNADLSEATLLLVVHGILYNKIQLTEEIKELLKGQKPDEELLSKLNDLHGFLNFDLLRDLYIRKVGYATNLWQIFLAENDDPSSENNGRSSTHEESDKDDIILFHGFNR